MAVLLAWVSWRETALDEGVWMALRQRAAARTRFPGRELGGPGWRLYAAPSHRGEADPIQSGSSQALRLLDWVPYDCAMAQGVAALPLSELRAGPPLAALELALNEAGEPTGVQLARDLLGRRTLVYAALPGGYLVASGEHILLAHPQLGNDPDLAFLTAYLCLRSAGPESSAFAQIRTLAAGQWLRLNAEGMRSSLLRLQPDWRWRSLSDAQIAAESRRLLDQATARCLAGVERVGLSLSAGIDSLAVAASLSRQPACPPVLAVTYGFEQWPQVDERPLAAQAAQSLGLPWCGVTADELDPLAPMLQRPVCPDTPLASLYREIKQAAYAQFEAQQASVWLSGAFGDHLCATPTDALVDTLRYGRWRTLPGLLWQAPGRGPGQRRRMLRRLAASIVGRSPRPPAIVTARPSQTQQLALDQRWQDELASWRDFPRPWQARTTLDGYAMFAASGEAWYAQRHGMHAADPFRDVDLVRWLLSLPAACHHQGALAKTQWRNTLPTSLPAELRLRAKSADLTPVLLTARERQASRWRQLAAQGADLAALWVPELRPSTGTEASPGSGDSGSGLLSEFLLAALALWWAQVNEPS